MPRCYCSADAHPAATASFGKCRKMPPLRRRSFVAVARAVLQRFPWVAAVTLGLWRWWMSPSQPPASLPPTHVPAPFALGSAMPSSNLWPAQDKAMRWSRPDSSPPGQLRATALAARGGQLVRERQADMAAYQALMLEQAREGKVHEVTRSFERMVGARLQPSQLSYDHVLQACERAGDPTTAERWMDRMTADGVQPTRHSYSAMIGSHAVAGETAKAAKWLAEMARSTNAGGKPDAAVHNAVLKAFWRRADLKGASEWFGQLSVFGVAPTVETYNLMLQICAEAGQAKAATDWFESMTKAGLTPNEDSYVQLIRASNKANDTSSAARWFNRLLVLRETPPSEDAFRAIINSCAKSKDMSSAAAWLERMISAGYQPDKRSYTMVINACAQQGDTTKAAMWLDRMESAGIAPDLFSCNAMLTAYNYAKDVVGVSSQLGRMVRAGVVPNEASYGLAMRTFAEVGDAAGACAWLERLELQGLDVRRVPFDKVIQSLSRAGASEGAADMATRAKEHGVKVSLAAYNSVIKAFLDAKQSAMALKWFKLMGQEMKPERSTYMMFIRHSARDGNAEEAAGWHSKLLEAGIAANAESYRAVLAGFGQVGDKANVFAWLERMMSAGFLPDQPTYTLVLKMFATQGDMAGVSEWMERMSRSGMQPDMKAYTTLITCWLQQPDGAAGAARWLDWMILQGLSPDAVAFNLVLSGYSKAGDLDAAQEVFRKMVSAGTKPNERSYESLLLCCGKRGDAAVAEELAGELQAAGLKMSPLACGAVARSYVKGLGVAINGGTGDDAAGIAMESAEALDLWLNRTVQANRRPGKKGTSFERDSLQDLLSKATHIFTAAGYSQATGRWMSYMRRNNLAMPADARVAPRASTSHVAEPRGKSKGKGRGAGKKPRRKELKLVAARRLVDQLQNRDKSAGQDTNAGAIIEQLRSAGGVIEEFQYAQVIKALNAEPRNAVELLDRMGDFGLSPTRRSYAAVLYNFVQAGDTEGTVAWFERMVDAGIEPAEQDVGLVVKAVMKPATDTERREAWLERVFAISGDKVKKRVSRWGQVIRQLAMAGHEKLAAQWAERAQKDGLSLSKDTFLPCAKAPLVAMDEARIWWWLGRAFPRDMGNATRISSGLQKFVFGVMFPDGSDGAVDETGTRAVVAWFDRLLCSPQWVQHVGLTEGQPPELPYGDLVKALGRLGRMDEATAFADRAAAAGQRLPMAAYHALIDSCVTSRDIGTAKQWFERIGASGLTPDAHAYDAVLQSMCAAEDANAAEEWFARMVSAGHMPVESRTYRSMVNLRISMGDLQGALSLARDAGQGQTRSKSLKQQEGARRTAGYMWSELFQAVGAAVQPDEQLAEDMLRTMIRAGHEPGATDLMSLRTVLGPSRCKSLCEELGVDVEGASRGRQPRNRG